MILHVDMDAFFASIEILDNPDLKGKCVIVGSMTGRGVVCAASYEARKYGVHSAQPMYSARRKCPHGIFLQPRFDRYKEISDQIMAVFQEVTPIMENISLDEAYLDVSASSKLFSNYEEMGRYIKKRILDVVGLTCSVGIAPNRFLAKIASEKDKPDGLTWIRPEGVEKIVGELPIGQAPGVGRVRENEFYKLGIQTLGDVQMYSEKQLIKWFGKYGRKLYLYARGIDETPIEANAERKQMGCEVTLLEDTDDRAYVEKVLLELTDELIERLHRRDTKSAKTVTLKLKYTDFKLVTHQETVAMGEASSDEIYPIVKELLAKTSLIKPIRLIGISLSNFSDRDEEKQPSLFSEEEAPRKWEKMDDAMVKIHQKFGGDILKRGAFTKAPAPKTNAKKPR